MKKTTLLMMLFAYSFIHAQTFPNPYCNITELEDIEEITEVSFANTVITNTNISDILVDFTSNIINVEPGQTYTLQVKGNSHGDYDNEYVAFIDWNQNGILNDSGESYYIGLIYYSDGYDGQFASLNITVPANAALGSTRIRITKTYTDYLNGYELVTDPCSISMEDWWFEEIFTSYGQALDFTLNVGTMNTNSFDLNAFSVYPNPATDILNINYKSEVENLKIFNLLSQEVFSKNLNSSQNQVNISNLSQGTYVAKVTAQNSTHSFKLVKK